MPLKRLFRLTWNENAWETPSGHPWDPKYEEDRTSSFEQRNGYGHEEWLFNPRFNFNDYQYGIIQGIYDLRKFDRVEEVHLFTIQDFTKTRFYLGYIKDVEILNERTENIEDYDEIFNPFLRDMEEELKDVGANYRRFHELGHSPNVRFRLKNSHLLTGPTIIKSKKFISNYFRFIPFKFSDKVKDWLFNEELFDDFNFNPGGPENKTDTYKLGGPKNSSGRVINKFHTQIEKELYKYLCEERNIPKNHISCGKAYVGGNIMDIAVLERSNLYEIYEIKTTRFARRNIREAIGQLLDYALWSDKIQVKKLIIVSPAQLQSSDINFFERIKFNLSIPIEYWQFNSDVYLTEDKFIIHK